MLSPAIRQLQRVVAYGILDPLPLPALAAVPLLEVVLGPCGQARAASCAFW